MTKCDFCGGSGWVEIIEYPASGASVQKVPCGKCGGSGKK